MLSHIFRSQFIQSLRRKGCSKKQAIKIYDKFISNLSKGSIKIKDLVDFALTHGSQFNSHLISSAFGWRRSPQGYDYWMRVSKIYEKSENE